MGGCNDNGAMESCESYQSIPDFYKYKRLATTLHERAGIRGRPVNEETKRADACAATLDGKVIAM